MPRTLRAPRRRERIRLEEDDVVRRLELRQPVRRRLASQRTNARLSNLRQPRRAVRHARHARLAQRREHSAAKFVQRQRRTLRDGNHRHRSRRGGRASRVSSARRRRMVRRRRARGSPATVDSSRDVTPRELHPPEMVEMAEMVRVHVRSDGVRTRARAPRQRHERAWRRRQRVQSRRGNPQNLRVANRATPVRRVVRRRREETTGRGTRAAIERPMCSAIESSAAQRGVFSDGFARAEKSRREIRSSRVSARRRIQVPRPSGRRARRFRTRRGDTP